MQLYRSLLMILALNLGILAVVPSNAADQASPDQIKKLIDMMGSGNFEEREKASEQLDTIGVPALEALRKALKSDDAEVRRRSEELIAKIEKRSESVKLLQPKKIKLSYKDTLVTQAVADFSKKSGYQIGVYDPQNKLKNRKVTLETGEVTFWEAFDQFCKQAGVVEGSFEDIIQLMPQPQLPNPNPRPNPRPVPVNPVLPVPPNPQPKGQLPPGQDAQGGAQAAQPGVARPALQPAVRPLPAQPPVPGTAPGAAPNKPVPPPGGLGALGQVGVQGGIGALGQVGFQGGMLGQVGFQGQFQGGFGGIAFPGQINLPPANQITLIDGKPTTRPTDARSAVRIRVSNRPQQPAKPAPADEIHIGLQVTPEPKLEIHQLIGVRVDKAIDDQNQKLAQVTNVKQNAQPGAAPGLGFGGANFGGGIGGFGGVPIGALGAQGGMIGIGGAMGAFGFGGFQGIGQTSHYTTVQLKKGEKAAKTIQELTGVITAQVTVPSKPLIEVDNILRAAGKTVKGKEGGHIKVLAVTQLTNGNVRVRFEMEPPAGAQGNMPGFFPGNPGIQILPAPPVPPVPPQKVPRPGQGQAPKPPQQAQLAAVQVAPGAPAQPAQAQARPAQIQVQLQPAPMQFNPGQMAFIGFNGFNNGVSLLDDKGNAFQVASINQMFRQKGNVLTVEHQMDYQVPKGQTPAKLVYALPKQVNIDIPFTLKGIPIP